MNRLTITTSLAFALSCGAAFAQTADPQQAPAAQTSNVAQDAAPIHGGHHHPNPQRQAEMISRKLNLTPDQTSRIEPILASRDQQMEALHGNTQLAPADRHAQMKSINQTAEQQMSGILLPDQMAQLKEMRHHRMHHGESGDAPAPAPTA